MKYKILLKINRNFIGDSCADISLQDGYGIPRNSNRFMIKCEITIVLLKMIEYFEGVAGTSVNGCRNYRYTKQ
jgi:hypothetical protein